MVCCAGASGDEASRHQEQLASAVVGRLLTTVPLLAASSPSDNMPLPPPDLSPSAPAPPGFFSLSVPSLASAHGHHVENSGPHFRSHTTWQGWVRIVTATTMGDGTWRSGFFFINSITRPLGFALPQQQGPDRLAFMPAGGGGKRQKTHRPKLPPSLLCRPGRNQACLQCVDPGLWSLLILSRGGERRERERQLPDQGCGGTDISWTV